MRYLGIDYGSKRIGIALSDDGGKMAFPAGIVVNNGHGAIKKIIEKIKKEHINRIVVGFPVGLDGRETAQTRITKIFINTLRAATKVPVMIENEILTSRMATASGMINDHVDAASAAIILQSYLDKNSELRNPSK